MKKIVFLIAGLSLRLIVMGQQIPSSDVVDASMPNGAKLMTKEQVIDYTKRNYKRSEISPERKNIYQLDGLIISFWDLSVNPGFKKSLQASRAEMQELFSWNKEIVVNLSKIITVNNIQYLVYEYQKNDEAFLRFQSEFNKNDKNICGIIQFKKGDEDKAQAALQTFLGSVHFKE